MKKNIVSHQLAGYKNMCKIVLIDIMMSIDLNKKN